MSKAWEAGCPIAQERPRDDEITQATKEIATEASVTGLKNRRDEK